MYVHSPPAVDEIIERFPPDRVVRAFQRAWAAAEGTGPGYLHWDKIRHLEPPEELTHEEWWLSIKMQRRPLLKGIPLEDAAGRAFVYGMPDEVLRRLHFVDQRCSGEIAMPEVVTADDQARQHYLVSSLMEEAIRSSQLEGATTSRAVAKELIRSGRQPKDRSERMIVNNYRALLFMREEEHSDLTPDAVLELQRIITEGTLENPDAAGRFQRSDEDRVAVFDREDGQPIHVPPPAEQLPARMQKLCDFANAAEEAATGFIHPVIRAILLHFWLAYDHPFEDGNGRTARALFYWSMRKSGYWLTEYLSISRFLRDAPAQYMRSFLLTETDDRDTTYFTLYQLEVIQRAVAELQKYLRRKVREVKEIERLVRGVSGFNHRQLSLLGDAARHTAHVYTYRSHAASHAVTHETARHDLLSLYRKGLFTRERISRRHVFRPVADLNEKLRNIAA